MAPSSDLELMERADGYALAAWRRLMLIVWRGQATAAGIERSRAVFEPWAMRQKGSTAMLIVVPGRLTRPPDEETRTAMQRSASSPAGSFRGMATLIEAEGFIAASARAVMARIHGAGPTKVFRTVDEAAAWAAALLDDAELTPPGLAEAIRVARAR